MAALLGTACAQNFTIPITPALKQQVYQYAKQVTKRECSGSYAASATNLGQNFAPADFDGFYRQMLGILQTKAAAEGGAGSSARGNLRPGESGYIYFNNTAAGAPDRLMILSRQKIGGGFRLVNLSCVLK